MGHLLQSLPPQSVKDLSIRAHESKANKVGSPNGSEYLGILALGRQRQEDGYEFKASLDYVEEKKNCLKKTSEAAGMGLGK